MMNKACFVLMVAMSPVSLFAGETMVTKTYHAAPTACNFRVDKCETSVATDPAYFHFKNGRASSVPERSWLGNGGSRCVSILFCVCRLCLPQQHQTVDELVALIWSKLSNCPEVTVGYDNDSGNITVHYLHSTCECDCDWVVNVRDVRADDFVWVRTTDNYSDRLGQMERRKFHCTNEENAQAIEAACTKICKLEGWSTFK